MSWRAKLKSDRPILPIVMAPVKNHQGAPVLCSLFLTIDDWSEKDQLGRENSC